MDMEQQSTPVVPTPAEPMPVETTSDITPPAVNLLPMRRAFSWVGICFAILLVSATLLQLLMEWATSWGGASNPLAKAEWWMWLTMALPMYLVAFPLCAKLLTRLPAQAPPSQALTKKQILALIPITVFLMYAGSIVGSVLSFILSGGQAQNNLEALTESQHPLRYIIMVVAAPVFEEWICRKWLLDRVRCHGELIGATMSGLIFGLLHQNFFQFFYAFALGFVFSWMYLRTGRIRYSVFFHMGVNFLGSVVAPLVLSVMDMEAVEALSGGQFSPEAILSIISGYLLTMAYGSMLLGLSVLGLILLIRLRRRIEWQPNPYGLTLKAALKPSLLNVGMILYMVLCTIAFILALFV